MLSLTVSDTEKTFEVFFVLHQTWWDLSISFILREVFCRWALLDNVQFVFLYLGWYKSLAFTQTFNNKYTSPFEQSLNGGSVDFCPTILCK